MGIPMVQTRTDSHSISANLTIVLRDDDEVPDYRTKEEHVEALAEDHMEDTYGNLRGTMQVCVTKDKEFESKTVYVATATVMN